MPEKGLIIAVYESSCGLSLIFGWDPFHVIVMIGPLYIEWSPCYV